MKPPNIYAEWVQILKQFEKPSEHEAQLIEAMEMGAISWSEGVAERFAEKCADMLSGRLKEIQRKFNVEFQNITSLEGIVNAIIVVRKRLRILVRFANMPSLPDELKKYLNDNLQTVVDGMQQGMVEDLKDKSKYESRYGEILVYVRKNPITLPTLDSVKQDVKTEAQTRAEAQESSIFIRKKKKLNF